MSWRLQYNCKICSAEYCHLAPHVERHLAPHVERHRVECCGTIMQNITMLSDYSAKCHYIECCGTIGEANVIKRLPGMFVTSTHTPSLRFASGASSLPLEQIT